MRIDIVSQSLVPPHPDVPPEIQNRAVQHQIADDGAQVRRLNKRAITSINTIKSADIRVRELLGATLLEQAKDGAALRKEITKLRAVEEDSFKTFVNKHGIDLTRLQTFADETVHTLSQSSLAAWARKGKRNKVVHISDVPAAIRDKKTNPWQEFNPPFAGWSWYYAWNMRGYDFRPTLFLDSGTGLIGTSNVLNAPRNDANIYGEAEYGSAVSLWYLMPTTGLLEAWIEVESVRSVADVRMHWDYIFPWSFPSGSADIHTYITLKADGPAPGERQRSEAYQTGHNFSGHFAGYENLYISGHRYRFRLLSDQAFAAGTWVLVTIGSLTLNRCYSNQVFATSDVNFQWLIRSVLIDSTGG
jgi:hypothetical protein